MCFTWRMSKGISDFLLKAGVVFGVFGTASFIADTWIRGDGQINPPSAFVGTCMGIALLLVSIGSHGLMRRAPK